MKIGVIEHSHTEKCALAIYRHDNYLNILEDAFARENFLCS